MTDRRVPLNQLTILPYYWLGGEATVFRKTKQFFREYTDGVDVGRVHTVLGRDVTRAFAVLTRDHPESDKPKGRIGRFWDRSKRLFLGLSYKLSPARRILFAVAMVLVFFGVQRQQFTIHSMDLQLQSPSPFLLLSIGALVFLIILELADRVLVRDELEVARQLQAELIADRSPEVDGWAFAFSYQTANTIGGDYYEFISLPDGRLFVAAGDASGHGIAAGLVMAVAGATLKLAVDQKPDPVSVAEMVNGALYRTGGPRAFMTLFCGVLDPGTGHFHFVCAGHPFPLHRKSDGSLTELGTGCLPLGLRPAVPLQASSVTIGPGEALVIYSDGIPETLDGEGRDFGFDRLQKAVGSGGSAQQIHDNVLRAVDAFAGEAPALDDRSLVVIRNDG